MKSLFAAGLLAICLSGCAQYQQAIEAGSNEALSDVKRVDDDTAQAILIAPQAMTMGAFSRLPQDARKCAIATLAGISLSGCTLTTGDVANIMQQQLNQHFGPAQVTSTVPVAVAAPAPPAVRHSTSNPVPLTPLPPITAPPVLPAPAEDYSRFQTTDPQP